MPRGRTKQTVNAMPVAVPQPKPDPVTVEEPLSGLYLFGQISDRTRRNIKTRDNTSAEIVTYAIQDTNGKRYFVDEYAPDEYYEIGEYAELPVYVKTFKKRTGEIGYSYCVQQPFGATRGEHF